MLETGPLAVNTYIIADEEKKEAAVFDPGGNVPDIMNVLEQDGLKLKYIINTHTHFDHVGGNEDLRQKTGAPILVHEEEAQDLAIVSERASLYGCESKDSKASQFIKAGDVIELGSIKIEVVDMRGHSKAGLGFVFEGEVEVNNEKSLRKIIVCGDALFAGSIGRTDFPGGNHPLLIKNIREKIFTLPDETLVLSGHGPITTVGREKQTNPFF